MNKLAMIQDKNGCRVAWITPNGIESAPLMTFTGRVQMKRTAPTIAKQHGVKLYNLKASGTLVEVESKPVKLSPTQQNAVDYMKANGGSLKRYPGGIWMKLGLTGKAVEQGLLIPGEVWFATPTIKALIAAGAVTVSGWRMYGDGTQLANEVTIAAS